MRLAESELILNPEGRIYHINLRPDELADTVITVGDPARVAQVSKYFDEVEFTTQHRELITHTGFLNGKRLSVVSTGMGTPNIDIVINELDAVVNIDFDRREIREEQRSLNIIRFGTAGGLQKDIPVGSLALTDYALGFDNLLSFYKLAQSTIEKELQKSLQQHFNNRLPVTPYVVEGSTELREKLQSECVIGMTATTAGFYGPQNRVLRAPIVIDDFLDTLSSWQSNSSRVINFEMETSAIYGMAKLLGHNACSISCILANRQTGEFEKNIPQAVDSMIQRVLNLLTK